MTKFKVHAPGHIMGFLVEKGSVAVDGISLTIVDVLKNGFTVVIIPHTAKLTTMGTQRSWRYSQYRGRYIREICCSISEERRGFRCTVHEDTCGKGAPIMMSIKEQRTSMFEHRFSGISTANPMRST